jgi:ABC-type dipeptide/oligopeptide/nickel transport system permease subunit
MTDQLVAPAPAPDNTPVSNGGAGAEFTVEARTQLRMVVRRFVHHRLAMAALLILVVLVVLSLFGGRFWRYDFADKIIEDANQGPSWEHPFGTDEIGKDMVAQVLRGAQKSVFIMLLVAIFSTTVGVTVGALAGYYRGWVDSVLMRITDVWLCIPTVAAAAVLSRRAETAGWWLVAVAIAVFAWMSIARVVRAEFLALREKEFVEAARASGASDRRIITKHLLPNVVGSIIVAATLTMAAAILAEGVLSYLGLGVRAPDISLGRIIANYQTASQTRPWLFYIPGAFIIVLVMCINLVGDGLRDAFDAKQNRVRA